MYKLSDTTTILRDHFSGTRVRVMVPLAVTLKVVFRNREIVKKWSLGIARTGPVPESGPMSLRIAKVVFENRESGR